MNLTFAQDNILFGAEYDEERYNKVIDQCGLKRDLELFDAGDKTEVGEKGLTLRLGVVFHGSWSGTIANLIIL